MPPPTPSRPSDPDTADTQRIAKLLARAGVASRREVERMIAEGRVALDGVVIDTPATTLPSLAGVTVDGQSVEAPAAARLFLYHKPAGLLVTERDPAGRATIYDRLPDGLPRVVPVGRLDLGTEGLLLLTTDGGLKRQLELPATGVERVYRARAYGPVTQAMLENLITGIEIEGVRYGPIDANLERRTGANVWIEMKLTEGKNREVRRVLDHLGLSVSRLIRTRYGPFALGDLMPGAVVEVRAHDIESFRRNPTRIDLPQPARQRGTQPLPIPTPVMAERPRPAVTAPAGSPTPRRENALRPAAPERVARTPRSANAGRAGRVDGASVEKSARAARARTFREATDAGERPPASTPRRRRADPPEGGARGDETRRSAGDERRLGRGRADRTAEARSSTSGERRPGRDRDRRKNDAAPIAKPARAARARAFRDASHPSGEAVQRRPAAEGRPGTSPSSKADKRPTPPRDGRKSTGPGPSSPAGRGPRSPRRPSR